MRNAVPKLAWLIPIRAMFDSSCPRLSRASTSRMTNGIKDMDGRDKPGHDEGEAPSVMKVGIKGTEQYLTGGLPDRTWHCCAQCYTNGMPPTKTRPLISLTVILALAVLALRFL